MCMPKGTYGPMCMPKGTDGPSVYAYRNRWSMCMPKGTDGPISMKKCYVSELGCKMAMILPHLLIHLRFSFIRKYQDVKWVEEALQGKNCYFENIPWEKVTSKLHPTYLDQKGKM